MVRLYIGTYTRTEPHVKGVGKGIYGFDLDTSTGQLTSFHTSPQSKEVATWAGINPTFLDVAHLKNKTSVLYVCNECNEPSKVQAGKDTGYVSSFKIEEDGGLTPLTVEETQGVFTCHVAVDPKQEFVAGSNYGGGSISLFPIDQGTGAVLPMSSHRHIEGASMANPERQEASHIHSSTWAPDSSAVFSADLGNDKIFRFPLDSKSQKLGAYEAVERPSGAGPRHFAFHPSNKFFYVTDELSNTIGVYPYDVQTARVGSDSIQEISTLPSDFNETNLAADIHVSSCGNFVYCSNRGHDSLACYKVDGATGKLSLIGFESTKGQFPRHFVIIQDLLLVANQDSHNIEVFKIDGETGKLHHTGSSTECPSPVCICPV